MSQPGWAGGKPSVGVFLALRLLPSIGLITFGALCNGQPLPANFGGRASSTVPQLDRDKSGTRQACRSDKGESSCALCWGHNAQTQIPQLPSQAVRFHLCSSCAGAMPPPTFHIRSPSLLPLVLTAQPWCSLCTQLAGKLLVDSGVEWRGEHFACEAPQRCAFL